MNEKIIQQKMPFLERGGEMGKLILEKDWGKTSLGKIENWSQSLRTTLSIILNSKFPMFLFWGPEFICFYNDAYRPSLGNDGKHPNILGGRGEDYLQEIWDDIKPIIDHVMAGGEANWSEDQLLPIYRNGKMEDVYWTFSYSAVYDESGNTSGVFVTCTETTKKIMAIKNLEVREEKFRNLVDKLILYEKVVVNIKEAVMITEAEPFDLPGPRIVYVNDAFYSVTGFTPEEVIGKTPRILHGPKTDRRQLDKIRKALESWQPVRVEVINYKKDGSEFFVEFEIVPVANEKGWFTHWISVQRNFTERKKAENKIHEGEELVRKSKELLELTFTNVPAAIFLYNNKKEVVFANEKAARLLGYDSVEKLLEEKYYDVLMQKASENFYVRNENNKAFQRDQLPSSNALKAGKQGEAVFSMEKKSGGEKIWLLNKSAPIFDEYGEVSMVLTTSTDITVQKTIEEQIKQSEENFRQLSNLMPEKVSKSDANGNVIYYNQSWLDYTGLSLEELNDRGWDYVIHPNDTQELTRRWAHSLMTGDDFEMNFRILNKHGQYRWHMCRSSAIKDDNGNIKNWLAATTDIEHQISFTNELEKQVEERTNELQSANDLLFNRNEQLSISENFNRSLTELSPNVVYIFDIENNKPIFLNQAGFKILSLDWEQIQKLEDNIQSLIIHSDDIFSIRNVMQKLKSSSSGEVFEHHYRVKNADGLWTPILARETAFKRNNKNEVIEIIGVAIDISDLKKAEKVLEQKNKDLEKMNKELQSFAYVSSHDLQEPLRKIQTFSNRILDKEYNNLSKTGQDFFNRIQSAAERMQQLIQDLLAFSRVNSAERKFENTDLKDIIDEVKAELKEVIEEKNAIIETDGLCKINIIPFQFQQLMQNLIGNSLKFTKPDTAPHIIIKSRIIKGNKLNNEKLLLNKNYCHITVKDNGIGFEDEYNEKIFEVFQRLHGKNDFNGTGIGLAIVKKIVENHNGIISAKGEVDQGATFTIYIPEN